jgi:hypothetical protein
MKGASSVPPSTISTLIATSTKHHRQEALSIDGRSASSAISLEMLKKTLVTFLRVAHIEVGIFFKQDEVPVGSPSNRMD